MDTKWKKEAYVPTIRTERVVENRWSRPSFERYKKLVSEVRVLTRDIFDLPYEPEQWLFRGIGLLILGYPELAVGDLYKALLLVQAALTNESSIGENALLAFGMKVWYSEQHSPPSQGIQCPAQVLKATVNTALVEIRCEIYTALIIALQQCGAIGDHLHMCREAMQQHPEVNKFSFGLYKSIEAYKIRLLASTLRKPPGPRSKMEQYFFRSGNTYMQAYPWMKQDVLRRGDHVLRGINTEFSNLGGKCHIGHSTVQDHISTSSIPNKNVFGLFASQDIKRGETIFVEESFTRVISEPPTCSSCCVPRQEDPLTMECCKTLFCSDRCILTAAANYHRVICGKDLAFLTAAAYGTTYDSHLGNLLLLRILAASIQEGSTNPLHSSFLSRLTPQYNAPNIGLKGLSFSLVEHIKNPIRMLENLGIDVFTNPNYDTWVLQTIRARLANNVASTDMGVFAVASCMPVSILFNHSCDPNVDRAIPNDGREERVFASQDIKKGEELFVSYIELNGVPKSRRQKRLQDWLGGPCMCPRCKKEK